MARSYWALIMLGAVLAAGCGGAGGRAAVPVAPGAAAPTPAPTPTPSPAPTPAPAPVDSAAATVERTVTLDEYSFTPAELVVPLGAVVKVTVVNIGQTPHDFNILSPYNIEGDLLPAGGKQVLTFMADQPGRFEIVCSQKHHKAEGMVGYLVVN